MKHFVYGSPYRIFLNTALGCTSQCQYCYLPDLDMGSGPIYISAEDALSMLHQLKDFVPGPQGTILSLGCYSECWDKVNKLETVKLLASLASQGNYLQMATKQSISREELMELDALAQYPGQLGIYLSVPTLSQAEKLEPGTALPESRLAPLRWQEELKNIYFVLYLKPVLAGITLEDAETYGQLMKTFHLPVIVGPLLTKGNTGNVLVGESCLREVMCDESEILKQQLSHYGSIYIHSTEIVDKLRHNRKSGEWCEHYLKYLRFN